MSTEFIDDFTERKRNLLQVWTQALILVRRKGGEQSVFNWLVDLAMTVLSKSPGCGHLQKATNSRG